MLAYVLNNQGNPLMPCTNSKARKLLKENKAKVVKKSPFTIQLFFGSTGYKQEINLGVDAGSKIIGVSATTVNQELFSAEVQLRNNIVNLLSTRRQYRRSRRGKTTRYRKPRFLNRVKTMHKGWLAPSVENKIQTHFSIVNKINKILPISKTIVETASFDIQKIKNPNIEGIEYQQGEQMDFWNVREYVLFRDGHKCHGKNNCKNKMLNVHHIETRKTGGNSPSNLITLCEECHDDYHKGLLKIKFTRGQIFKDATFMGVMRWKFYDRLKKLYPNVSMTYGYITKSTRITNKLEKTHNIDAKCISGNPLAKSLDYMYFIKQVRKHNRQIHKAKLLKGGKKRLNQSQYVVKGFRLFDKVKFENKTGFIFARRISGYFSIKNLNGESLHTYINYKQLELIETRKSFLWEMRINN